MGNIQWSDTCKKPSMFVPEKREVRTELTARECLKGNLAQCVDLTDVTPSGSIRYADQK